MKRRTKKFDSEAKAPIHTTLTPYTQALLRRELAKATRERDHHLQEIETLEASLQAQFKAYEVAKNKIEFLEADLREGK